MKWYEKYNAIHNQLPDTIDSEIFEEINEKIKSKFSSPNPDVSLVVIAYNEEKNIPSCLWSLSNMESKYKMEIIGVNNNSSDRTEEIFKKCGINPYLADRYQSPGASRQCGLINAKGKYYFCIDADLIYPPTYVDAMMGVLEKDGVACVSSTYTYIPDANHSAVYLKGYEMVRSFNTWIMRIKRPTLCVRGAVFAHNTELARKVGGYREDIFRGEDGSMARALLKYGALKFTHNKKAAAKITCENLGKESLFSILTSRINVHAKNLFKHFDKKKDLPDSKENLSKKI